MSDVTGVKLLAAGEVSTSSDPAALLKFAWAMEPDLRLSERYGALDRLAALLTAGRLPAAPPDRDWELELLAERAIDAAAYLRLSDGLELAAHVLSTAPAAARIARARATLARGRALVWLGTEEATRQGDQALQDAGEQFRALDNPEWHGFTVFWRGHSVCYQNGDLRRAAGLMGEALEIMGPDSPRRTVILTFYADALTELGDFATAQRALDEAAARAERDGATRSRAYTAWTAARLNAGRDDAEGTLAELQVVDANRSDWFETMTGLAFLAAAADQLDRVGLNRQAGEYLERARRRVVQMGATTADGTPQDEPLREVEATMLARSGDPHEALGRLAALVGGSWLEKRLLWRNTLLTAWATLRAGSREDSCRIAARALSEAVANGGIGVAVAGEAVLARALAPLAEEAGSGPARGLLSEGRVALIRLFGAPSIVMPDGRPVSLPAGTPGALVRWLALTPSGLETETVLGEFYPDVDLDSARGRLRQVLKRIRSEVGELVLREGERLTLAPVWVDVRAFRQLAGAAGRARGSRSVELAWAAMALAERGPLLISDPYAAWADAAREEVAIAITELSVALASRR